MQNETKITRPALLVMAAGMGSRYGGLKQIDPMTDEGEVIVDFSLYDAMLAGFEDAVFVIRKEHRDLFDEHLSKGAGRRMNIRYAYQDLSDLPEGYSVPEGREKPWGTAQAVLAARGVIGGPFAVINSDDYYGAGAFQTMYDFLERAEDKEIYEYAMVGFELAKTLSANGSVSRGVCRVENGRLLGIIERGQIMRKGSAIECARDDGSAIELPDDSTASMNFWGFTNSIFGELAGRFPAFLDKTLSENPLKGEYPLPGVVSDLIAEGKAEVTVLPSHDRWYGVTYKEDREDVVSAFRSMKDKGFYPERLWAGHSTDY